MKVITSCSNTYGEITRLTHPYFPKDVIIKRLEADGISFGSAEFNLMSKVQEVNFTEEIKKCKMGDIIMQCDSDVLLNAPITWFEEQLGGNDMIAQYDHGSGACFGFFVMRVSPKMIEVFEEVDRNTTAEINNQVAFNRTPERFGIKLAYFDTKDVWNYGCLGRGVWNGEEFQFPDNLKAFHANWTVGNENKVKLLKMALKKYKPDNPINNEII